ncbi:FERM domain-containing protein 4B [Aphelenchoides bicaudatus]|nr:FERM domain-containing protein 4B [Aphelenchoides bicaudatus]
MAFLALSVLMARLQLDDLNKPNESAQKLTEQLENLLGSSTKLASLASSSSIDSYSTISRSSMPPSSLRIGTLSSTSLSVNKNLSAEEKQELDKEYKRLKTKLKSIEDELITHLNELKTICLEEAQISGVMPKEVYMTLLPGEKLPPVTKRVGTAFKLDQQLIENSNGADRLVQLQADIQLHRKIVEAAERLANDKTTNKSVRRKRRKDFQAAALKLRGLEKGLYQLRISASKPDISTNDFPANGNLSRSRAGSGFSLNSLKNWPNFIGGSRIPKSCPTTPRGSIPDLSAPMDATDKLPINVFPKSKHSGHLSSQQRRPIELQPSWSQMPTTSTSGSSLPPAIPSRRPTVTSLNGHKDGAKRLGTSSASEFPTYTNIGYKSSVPYKSAYRQQNYPTLEQYPMQRSKSVAGSPSNSTKKSSLDSSTSFSVEKDSPGVATQHLRVLPTNSCTALTQNGVSIPTNSISNSVIERQSKVDKASMKDNLSAIVSHMNQTAANLRNPRVIMRNTQPSRDFSTASLDRRNFEGR